MKDKYYMEKLNHTAAKALVGEKYDGAKNYYMIQDRDSFTILEEDPKTKKTKEISFEVEVFKEDKEFEDSIEKEMVKSTKYKQYSLIAKAVLIFLLLLSGGVLIYGLQTL